MGLTELLIIFIGGGGLGVFVSAYFTRKSDIDDVEIQLLDRAYIEIARLDGKIDELQNELQKEKTDNKELKKIVQDLRYGMDSLKRDIKNIERKRGDS